MNPRLIKFKNRSIRIFKKLSCYAFPRSKGNGSAICAIALGENKYIDEWITYHLCLGFDRIVIYDNSATKSLSFLSERFGSRVEVKSMPGLAKQLPSYNRFIREFMGVFRWAAFLDCDEFIVLKKHRYINDFLEEYCKSGALALNWFLFGSNGHKTYSPEPVLSRFTRRQKALNPHVKSIVNLRDTQVFNQTPHVPLMLFGTVKDCAGHIIHTPFNPEGSSDIAVLHHYWTKSREEWFAKVNRGKADSPEKHDVGEFEAFDGTSNEIVDTSALDFYLKFRDEIQKSS